MTALNEWTATTGNPQQVEHDRTLLTLVEAAYAAEAKVAAERHTLATYTNIVNRGSLGHRATEDSPAKVSEHTVLPTSPEVLVAAAADAGYESQYVRDYAERLTAALAALDAADEAVDQHEQGYTGWQRFWLVTNVNGHIHRTRACSTCYVTTRFALLPDLSGSDEAAAVEEQGGILCSVCFPDAPTEWTEGESKVLAAERAAKAEAKAAAAAEREAKKDAKRLVPGDDDGYAIEIDDRQWPERLKTVAAAKKWLTDFYEYNVVLDWYPRTNADGSVSTHHPSYPTHEAPIVAALLIGRPGVKETTVEEVLAAALKRAEKRN